MAHNQVAYALATVADLGAKLAKTTLTAPADGVTRLLVAEPGEAISPGQPVLTPGVNGDRWFGLHDPRGLASEPAHGREDRPQGRCGRKFDARMTELRPLGEFAVWRAVGDRDINSSSRAPIRSARRRSSEPCMTCESRRHKPARQSMRPSQDQPRRPTTIVFLGKNGDDASVHPRAVHDVLDLGLARLEMPLPRMLGQDREAAEVAEAIVIDRCDLAGYLMFGKRRNGRRRSLPRHGAGLRWRDLDSGRPPK